MRKLYFLLYSSFSVLGFSQTILNRAESTTRTVQDPNAVILAPGFHASSTVSNPFVAKIGAGTENIGGGPDTPSTAGSTNPSGTTETETNRFHDTQGNIDVNGGGQLQFTLPIALPPGVKSVAPQINLVYTSGSGNGIAGYGWNLSGITTISRTGKTIENDGEVKSIQFDYSDYYSFNGQRLILKSGEYGKDGAEYVTEKFSNIKIKSLGRAYNILAPQDGPAYWEVTFEDGSQAWYGSINSISDNARTPMEYNITEWKDAQGNYITYAYAQNIGANVAVISSIQWGGNKTLGKNHFNEILFNYANRDVREGAYVGGKYFLQDKLLSNIVVKTNESQFKKYEITYKKLGTNYQFVDYIKEKNAIDEEANTVVFENSLDATVTNIFTQNSRYDEIYGNDVLSGDFNGDGKIDFINGKSLMLGRLDGTGEVYNIDYEGKFLAIGATILNTNVLSNKQVVFTGLIQDKILKINSYIFNGSDLELINTKVFDISSYNGVFIPHKQEDYYGYYEYDFDISGLAGDFDGDGLSELIINIQEIETTYATIFDGWGNPDGYERYGTVTNSSSMVFFTNLIKGIFVQSNTVSTTGKIVDFNGNGKDEILSFANGKIASFELNNQNQFVEIISTVKESLDEVVYFGDFNGDGKTDILAPIAKDSSDWIMYISTGNDFRKEFYPNLFQYQPSWQGSPRKSRNIQRTYSTSDLNKDGKSDFVIFESQVWFRDGLNWNNPDSSYGFNYLRNEGIDAMGKPIFSNIYNIAPKELNWDGEDINYSMYGEHYIPLFGSFKLASLNTEFAIIHKTKLITWNVGSKLNEISKVSAIEQGKIQTKIVYSPLTALGSVYTKSYQTSPLQYPFAVFEENLSTSVVSQISQDQRKQDFRYVDLVFNLQGRSIKGFRQSARSSWYTNDFVNTKTWSGMEVNPLKESLPIKEWVCKNSDFNYNIFPSELPVFAVDYLSLKEYEYKIDKLLNGLVVTSYGDADKPKIVTAINPYIITSKDFQKDIKTVHTVVSYDNLYLPTKSTTDINDGFAITTAEVAYNAPTTTGSNYSIGKPLWKKETIQAYGDTKGAKEEYIYTGNLLTKKRTFDRNNSEYIDETYLYDGFGNVIQKKIENPSNNDAVAAATTKSQYDDEGRFVIKKTDNLDLETNITYNNWGQILTQTDPFHNKLTNTYDAWGKLLTSNTNIGGTTTYTYEKLSNGDSKITEYSPDNDQKITYSNKLGQSYKSSVKGISQDSFVSQEVQYDVLGRKYKESEPYFEGTSATQWNKTEYDDYSRPIKVTSFTGKIIETVYNGRTVTATETNANNRFKTQVYDPVGNISSTTDKGGTINFKYNAAGENIESKYGSNIVKTGYDQWGRKNFFYDPSNSKDEAHAYKYEYNGYGQLTHVISPKGHKYYKYNPKGQLYQQNENSNDNVSTNKNIIFEYSTKGLITKKYGTSNGKPYGSYVNYDSQGRVLSSGEQSNGKYFLEKGITYDDKGRVVSYEKGLYSSGIYTKTVIQNVYGSWSGDMYQLKDKASGKTLWELTETNAKGSVLKAKFGGTSIENTYDANNFLTNVSHINPANTNTVLQLSYSFNAIKNELNSRTTGGSLNIVETFAYDENNRLLNWTNPKTEQLSNNVYDTQGRIKENDQVGIIKFDNATKIYQPTGFKFNPAGQKNIEADLLQKITYNENNDPVFIDGVNGDVAFEYGLNAMRQKVTYGGDFGEGNIGKYTKFYSEDGGYEIILDHTTGKEKHVIYIGGSPYESNIIYLKKYQEATASYKFLHKDYLGSILAISDESGNILEQRHFDAWGNLTLFKINGIDQDVKQFNDLSLLDRGYTSHEHYMEVGIIHMNGRLYDPLLRRFLNADENIQDPHNTQVYNKYAYVINNPLAYVDVSGEDFGLSAVLIGIGTAIFTSMATDFYLNRPVNLENMFQSVMMSVMSAGVANGIGDVFKVGGKIAEALGKTGTIIARAGAHAITQGVFSSVQGGNFWSGALSGTFASIAGDLLKLGTQNSGEFSVARSDAFKMLTGAVMGGVGSKLGGGNFWMGAAQGLVVTVFNHMATHEPPPGYNDNYYADETGEYYKVDDYLYAHYVNGKKVNTKFISGLLLKTRGQVFREWTSGFSRTGEIISQLGLGLTVSVVGAEVGVPLMAIGGWVSLSSNSLTAVSYGFEGKYDKMFGESVKIGIEYGVQKATGGLLKMKSPGQSEIANEAQRAVAEEINGKITSEGIKMIEVEVKTRNY